MMELTLRKASFADADELFRWRNDAATRQASFNSAPLEYNEHLAWLKQALADENRLLLIGQEKNGEPVGVVRFDALGKGTFEINVNLAPEKRGRGMGRKLISSASQDLVATRGPVKIMARIKKDNNVSLRAFVKAGYQPTGEAQGVVSLLFGGKQA